MCKTPKMKEPIPPRTPSDPTIMLLVRNEEQQVTIAAAMTEMTTAMTSMNLRSTNLWDRSQRLFKIWIFIVNKYCWNDFCKKESLKLRHYFKWHSNAYQGQYSLSRNLFTSNKTRWCNVLFMLLIGSENIERKWISFPVIVSMTSHTWSMSNFDLQYNIINFWLFHALYIRTYIAHYWYVIS